MTDQSWGKRLRPSLVQVALLASLGLNLFFAGWWTGAGLRHPPPPRGPVGELTERLRGRISSASLDKLERLRAEMEAGFQRQFTDSNAIRAQLRTILISEPFDANAFSETLARLNGQRANFDAEMTRRITALVETFSPEERRALADVLLALHPGPLG